MQTTTKPMTPAQVRKARKQLEVQLKQVEYNLQRIKLERQKLQSLCQHKNVREWTHTCYDSSSDHHWHCDDCGGHTVT